MRVNAVPSSKTMSWIFIQDSYDLGLSTVFYMLDFTILARTKYSNLTPIIKELGLNKLLYVVLVSHQTKPSPTSY